MVKHLFVKMDKIRIWSDLYLKIINNIGALEWCEKAKYYYWKWMIFFCQNHTISSYSWINWWLDLIGRKLGLHKTKMYSSCPNVLFWILLYTYFTIRVYVSARNILKLIYNNVCNDHGKTFWYYFLMTHQIL